MKFAKLIHFLFPNRCVCCRCVVTPEETVCLDCAEKLNRIQGDLCRICGGKAGSCDCKSHPKWFDRCISPFYYDGAAKNAVLNVKYRRNTGAAEFLADNMKKSVLTDYHGVVFDCITYVPMFAPKRRKRGYNQTELLARLLSQKTGTPCETLLKQDVNIETQHELPANMREQNVAGAYSVCCDVKCKTVLIVDDIVTTGATLSECARMLKLNGATAVYCVTAAKTMKK